MIASKDLLAIRFGDDRALVQCRRWGEEDRYERNRLLRIVLHQNRAPLGVKPRLRKLVEMVSASDAR